jgi:hypothetical protein
MNTRHHGKHLLVLLLAAVIGAAPALAQPPWAGGGKGNGGGDDKHGDSGKGNNGKSKSKGGDDAGKGTHSSGKAVKQGAYFDDRNRSAVQTYYASAGKGDKGCPPGLAKKNNGCMPPGQAKKWHVGQPLPATVVTYPVPHQIVIGLPPVPSGHKYVQVAGDILLVAVGSMMVVDGINGLTRR